MDVQIQVLDVNDNSPMFYDLPSQLRVVENMVNISICQLNARDSDLGVNGKLKFSFENPNDAFYIDPNVSKIAHVCHR